jgi:catechol 2,3-dioxygenase-like lactoylglutathione lyase family enzyme
MVRMGFPVIGVTDLVRATAFWTAALGLRASEEWGEHYPAEPDFVVLADPDGNVFCVVDLSRAPSSG